MARRRIRLAVLNQTDQIEFVRQFDRMVFASILVDGKQSEVDRISDFYQPLDLLQANVQPAFRITSIGRVMLNVATHLEEGLVSFAEDVADRHGISKATVSLSHILADRLGLGQTKEDRLGIKRDLHARNQNSQHLYDRIRNYVRNCKLERYRFWHRLLLRS